MPSTPRGLLDRDSPVTGTAALLATDHNPSLRYVKDDEMTATNGDIDDVARDRTGELASTWVTAALVVLAVPNLVAALWGLVAPEHWFDNFPGWAPRLVAAFPPFNEHLATDAASGLFAAGVAATIALWWRRRDVVIVAMAAFLAFALPHAVFHLAHPADALSGVEDLVNTVTLWAAVAIAVAILMVAIRSARHACDCAPDDT
jgi:hypothetical protein